MMRVIVACLVALVTPLAAQRDLHNRDAGPNGNGKVNVDTPQNPTSVKTITHIVLCAERQWSSVDGKLILAKLIAFEDMPEGKTQPPAHPTVVKESAVRLMIGKKASVVPLSRLSAADQEFVEKQRLRFEAKK